jgi:hypothetical protein
MQTILVYGRILDGFVTTIEEVGISGLRSTHAYESKLGTARGAQRQQPVNSGIVVNNFNFNFNSPSTGYGPSAYDAGYVGFDRSRWDGVH